MNVHASTVTGKTKSIRCAIYTRKSSDEGLEQEFNSLNAQYEASQAYAASQRHEGWKLLPDRFGDGGLSGGTMERPALQRLLAEIDAGRIGMVVVYKSDRLTRSLADFARLVERLDAKGCSFVSVTQAFNTSTSMGRLTLNVLLSFAQFEREVTAERFRDKIAASKKKGLWMGGSLPLGYDRPTDPTSARILRINPAEAETVRALFALYADLGSLSLTRMAALDQNLSPRKADHLPDKSVTITAPFSSGQLHYLLTNPVYRGQIRHKDAVHPGQHAAIIDADHWERVQTQLQATSARKRKGGNVDDRSRLEPATQELASALIGRIFDETGDRLTPSHTNRHNQRFRYYVSRRLILGQRDPSGWRLPAEGFEQAILGALRQYLTVRAERHDLLLSPDASLAEHTAKALKALLQGQDARLWPLVEKVAVAPGLLQIILDQAVIAATAACRTDALNPALMQIELPFQLRRRGVETRMVTGTLIPEPDHVLQKNLARAHGWVQQIKRGTTMSDLARKAGYSESYIRNRVVFAFLAPKIQRAILAGTIGPDWTTDRLLRIDLPLDWSAQTRLLGL